jgi:hypothetical protein
MFSSTILQQNQKLVDFRAGKPVTPGADFRGLVAIKESEIYKLGKNQLCRRSLLLNTGKFFLLSIVT